ncbi:hypothetical protein QP794_23890 [Paenibacillus sp. UMB7766-LJ446]|uniref:hypothetical protein n=1 Tax=Paenibacillus sp. UMB7766-LJ446 TaxID=3046313 RepID=UPI00254E2AF5|nr:hypothetical protein [Paenibacillus sp. UMB7766-LJ446]MDK8193134.1 hypothetical protein [Paenibacillus sp. UMB7766-LJ446]
MRSKSRFMRSLTSDIQLYTALIDRTPIVVFIGTELIGSGVIEDITEVSVAVKGERYMREICTFKYAG